jgi:tRNA(fMet)-specific endonuclease VapC
MTRYLLDTNHVSEAIRRVSRLRERIRLRARQGDIFGTCSPVLCELEVGIQQTGNPPAARRRLAVLLRTVRVWPVEADIAQLYGAFYLELQRKGRALSQIDIMLAALARQMDLTLLTTDRDFEALPDVRTETWLA